MIHRLVTGFLYISWRDSLTKSLHKKYFATAQSTYRANEQTDKDNPDQRIASDASAVSGWLEGGCLEPVVIV